MSNSLFQELNIPLDPNDSTSQAGPITKRINKAIMDIQYGEVDHPWSVLVNQLMYRSGCDRVV